MYRLETERLYCEDLGASPDDERDIKRFSVKPRDNQSGEGLASYIRSQALFDEHYGSMRTYLVRAINDSSLVGYFSLKAGLASWDERQNYDDSVTFDTLPGVELADFAVNYEYTRRHEDAKGLGLAIFRDFIMPVIREARNLIGIKIVYNLCTLPKTYKEL